MAIQADTMAQVLPFALIVLILAVRRRGLVGAAGDE